METSTDRLIQEVKLMQQLFLAYTNAVMTEEQKEKFVEIIKSGLINPDALPSNNS